MGMDITIKTRISISPKKARPTIEVLVKGIYIVGGAIPSEALYSSWDLNVLINFLLTHFTTVGELVVDVSCLSQVKVEKDNKDNKTTIVVSMYMAILPLFVLSTLVASPTTRYYCDRSQVS